jgi:hypothetical protein
VDESLNGPRFLWHDQIVFLRFRRVRNNCPPVMKAVGIQNATMSDEIGPFLRKIRLAVLSTPHAVPR